MAETTTARFGLRQYSDPNTDAFSRTDYNEDNLQVENLAAIYGQGATTPTPGTVGKFFWHTVESRLYFDDGVALQPIGTPAGTVAAFAGGTVPAGWLLCDGSAVSRTTYARLYAALGGASSPYGQGNGSTTFNLPDLRQKFIAGAQTGQSGYDLAATGGTASHVLTANEMPTHSHAGSSSASAGGHDHSTNTSTAGSHTHSGTSGAGGDAHTHSATSGSAGGHTHTAQSGGGHAHTATAASTSHDHVISITTAGAHSHGVTVNNNSHDHTISTRGTASTSHSHAGPEGDDAVALGPKGASVAIGQPGAPETDSSSHGHTASSASAGDHTHPASANSVPHAHGITVDAASAHTHTTSSDGAHSHSVTTGNASATHTHAINTAAGGDHAHTLTSGGAHTHGLTIASSGGGAGHENRPPYVALNYIIRV